MCNYICTTIDTGRNLLILAGTNRVVRRHGPWKDFFMQTTTIPKRTMSVTEAGEALGVSRKAAYQAAEKGEIHVIRIGKRMRVPVAWLERKLAGADA